MDNPHLKIAKFLNENREIADALATAINTTLDSLDALIWRKIKQFHNLYPDLSYELNEVYDYWVEKFEEELTIIAGIHDYTPHGDKGEQTYKFIQEFTQTSVDQFKNNYSQAEFNNLTE